MKTVQFLGSLSGLEPGKVALLISDHLVSISSADRVTVITPQGDVLAMSGQKEVDARSAMALRCKEFAEVMKGRPAPIWSGFTPEGVAWYRGGKYGTMQEFNVATLPDGTAVEAAFRDMNALSGSLLIGVVPLKKGDNVCGYLVVEQFKRSRPGDMLGEKADLISMHSAGKLDDAIQYSKIPMVSTRKGLKLGGAVLGRSLLVRLAIVAAVLVVPFFIQMDLRMEGEGTLDPEFRAEAVHRYTGGLAEVKAVHVKHGQKVKAGQLLFELQSKELDRQVADMQAQIAAKEGESQELRTALWSDRGELTETVRARNIARIQTLKNELDSRRKELASLIDMQESLTVRAKSAGLVIKPKDFNDYPGKSFGPKESLATLADPDKAWLVSIWVTESQMRHIRDAIENKGMRLPVTFYLGTDPNTHYEGYIREVDHVMEVRQGDKDGMARLLIKVDVDKDVLKYPEAGASVRAHVECGKCNLYYWLLWPGIDFIGKTLF
jgi:hypothetical protein